MMTLVRAVALGLGLALTGAAVGVGSVVSAKAAPRASVEGRCIPAGVAVDAWLRSKRDALLSRTVRVAAGDEMTEMTLASLGVDLDVAETAAAVRARGDRSIKARLASLAGGFVDEQVDVPYVFSIDESVARERIAAFAPAIRREPVNARLDLAHHARIDDRPGAELDEAASLEALRAFVREPNDEAFHLASRSLSATITSDSIAHVDVSRVLASYETSFSLAGEGAGRAVNIRTAARHLDGYLIGPGEMFSFNDVVGPRTEAAGFTHAPEIIDDEMQDGIGGGTCQLASTLHAAAVFGAIEVVKRRSHRRPSAYTQLGLDATVVDGQVDLRLRNPFPFPVMVHAFLPKATSVRVEFLGAEPVAKVDYRFAIVKSDDFFRRVTYQPDLGPGEIVRHQKGRRGADVVSIVTITFADGQRVERSYRSEYAPVPEVIWVGSGVDDEALPELPEGATRVERRGFEGASASSDPSG